MPAARLPWFRFWVGATAHEKVRQLDDATFRTWVELLDAAAQQPVRGRFANRTGAAAVVRRPVKHVGNLIHAGLIDEDTSGRLTMHDWDWWQRWRKEDANDTRTPAEQLQDERANATRTPTDQPPNGHVIDARMANGSPRDDPASLREKKREKRDRDRDKDDNPPRSPLGDGATGEPVPKPNRGAQVIDALRERDLQPTLTARDFGAIKKSSAAPGLIAEVYAAVFNGEYGDDFMLKRLSIHEAIGWIDGYRAWKAKQRGGRVIVDHTGCPAGCTNTHPERAA